MPRNLRVLDALPAPVRWLLLPCGLLACTVLVIGAGGGPPWEPPLTAPAPGGAAAGHCRALAEALPDVVQGHRRAEPTASPYVAVWGSSPRTVLRCGVARPKSLNLVQNQLSPGPNVHDVQWYVEKDGHGGYRCTTTLRSPYVEVSVPAGAYPSYADPLIDLSAPIRATIPDLSGQTATADDPTE